MVSADAAEYRIGARALDDEARADYEAMFDPGTGLPKRVLLYDRLVMALARTRRAGTAIGVFFVRPDSPVDDATMAETARLIAQELRLDDTVARTGPAELVVVCHLRDASEARVVIRRIAHSMSSGRKKLALTIGHAVGGSNDDPGEVLVRAASATAASIGDALGPIPDAIPEKLRSAL